MAARVCSAVLVDLEVVMATIGRVWPWTILALIWLAAGCGRYKEILWPG